MNILQNDYHHDAGAVDPLLFRPACLMGLEGIVSKHRFLQGGSVEALDQGEKSEVGCNGRAEEIG